MPLELGRRQFITGLISFVAAPAIVRASSLMPVRSLSVQSNLDLYLEQILAPAMRRLSNDIVNDIMYGGSITAIKTSFQNDLWSIKSIPYEKIILK